MEPGAGVPVVPPVALLGELVSDQELGECLFCLHGVSSSR
jgi:hypothetical protein